MSRLSFDEECAAIERELTMTPGRDDFELYSRWAVTVHDMARHLMTLEPTIIHFAGHGVSHGSEPSTALRAAADDDTMPDHRTRRDLGIEASPGPAGICLLSEDGGPEVLSAPGLAGMIRTSAKSARLLVLNACYSDTLAEELCTVIDCVVGMTGAIHDAAARAFAVGFYRGLGYRKSVADALDHARATLTAKHFEDAMQPRCRTRAGVDANAIVFASA